MENNSGSDSTSTLPVQILRNTLVNPSNNEVHLVGFDQEKRVYDLVEAVFARFTMKDVNQVTIIPLSQPSGYKDYSLLDLINFAYSSLYKDDGHHSEYLRETVQLNQRISEYDRQHNHSVLSADGTTNTKPRNIEAISYIDRRDLSEYLKGTLETSVHLQNGLKKRAADEGLETESAPKRSRFDVSSSNVVLYVATPHALHDFI